MIYKIQYHLFILQIVVLFVLLICEAEEQGKQRNVAMDLIFLQTYENNVGMHLNTVIPETNRNELMEKWTRVMNGEDATNVLQRLEKHWSFIINLTNSTETDITNLLVAVHIKILALHQGTSYLLCVTYYSKLIMTVPERCRNLALHLLVFSQLGTNELIQKVISSIWSQLPAMTEHLGIISESLVKLNNVIHHAVCYITILRQSRNDDPIDKSFIDPDLDAQTYQESLNQICERMNELSGWEYIMFDLMFGNLPLEIRYLGFGFLWSFNADQEVPLWDRSLAINQKFNGQFTENVLGVEYDITKVMRADLIIRSEIYGVRRRYIVEVYECIIPQQLELFIADEDTMSNVKFQNIL